VDVFNDKLASVGSRIQDQERELARRRLRCQDIDREIERLRAVIAENADEAIETASSLNRAKSKLSAVERALLAAVSELTMYRALTAALADAKSRNIAEVDALRLSLET
jgi:septal ring factor EnvC (AmiA/AmiB activator)